MKTALLLQDPKQQASELEKIVEDLRLLSSSPEKNALQKMTLFELHGRMVESCIRVGIEKLKSGCSPLWVSFSSQIVEYRNQQKQNLDEVFSRLDLELSKVAKTFQEKAQKLKWTYKNDFWTARAALRKYDAQFSRFTEPKGEKEQRRKERLVLLIYHIMDELFPILGAGVILIYAAFQGMVNLIFLCLQG